MSNYLIMMERNDEFWVYIDPSSVSSEIYDNLINLYDLSKYTHKWSFWANIRDLPGEDLFDMRPFIVNEDQKNNLLGYPWIACRQSGKSKFDILKNTDNYQIGLRTFEENEKISRVDFYTPTDIKNFKVMLKIEKMLGSFDNHELNVAAEYLKIKGIV